MILIDTRHVGARKLFCVTPGCGQQGEVLDRHHVGLPPPVIIRKFEQKGWEVGRDSTEDYCPSCAKARVAARRARRVKPISVPATNVVPMVPRQESPMPASNGADHPPQMGRDERRIIFSHLQEVYEDERSGYRTPWTDAAVAKHLGVPAAWVVLIREENFGPAHDNQEIREMLIRVETNARAARTVLDEAKKIRTEASALVERVNGLSKQCSEIGRNLDGLLAIASRVEKAVS